MKIRIVCIMLAVALLASMMTVSFADEAEDLQLPVEETVVEETAVFCLDGEPLYGVTAECIGGVYYVTLSSIMPLLDAGAVVEESAGVATVTAEAVEVTEPAAEVAEEPIVPEGTETTIITSTTMEYDRESGMLLPVITRTLMALDPVTGAMTPIATLDEEAEPAEEQTEAVVEVLDTLTFTASVGDCYVIANGRYLYVADGVMSLSGSVAVPIRVLAEALNMAVSFEKSTGCVALHRSTTPGFIEDGADFYDEESVYWLSRIISCESGNQPMTGKIAVANVVLNRVYNPNFPSTIYDVIFQKNQFSPVASGSIYREPNAASVIAAKLALDGAEVLPGVLFFNRAGLKCYASRNREFVATIGGHSFYA